MAAIITSVINKKGGVGKTTLTHHLATGLTFHRKRTLVIDLDPQCNLSFLALGAESYHHLIQQNTPTIKTVFDAFLTRELIHSPDIIQNRLITSSKGHVYVHADIVLSHNDLEDLDPKLSNLKRSNFESDHMERTQLELEKLSVLKRFVEEISNQYDYVFFDCPTNLHLITQNAIFASHYYLVPSTPDHLPTVGISSIRNKIEMLDDRFASLCAYVGEPNRYIRTQFAGVIFNMVKERLKVPTLNHRHYIDHIRQLEGDLVFRNYLTDGDGIEEAALRNHPVYAFDSKPRTSNRVQKQVDYMRNIVKEFMLRTRQEVQI